MLKSMLAACMVAGGLFAFSPIANAAVVSPSALEAATNQSSNIIEVRRGGHHFGGRHFGGHGHRHHGGWRRGGWPLWGVAPFVGYGAYSYGYYGSGCGWLWRRYQVTGSWYWYQRWQDCRYY